jgi:YbbR domain-containing protein
LWPVKVLSLGAAVLLYFFTNLLDMGNREISLPIKYVFAPGYSQSSEVPTKARLVLRGDSEKLYGLAEEELQVIADFSRHTQEGQFQVALRLKRSGAAANLEPLDIRIEPGTVKLSIEPSVTKDLPVNIRFTGNPKPGYQLVSYSVAPDRLRLTGPASRLEGLSSVDTDPVDLSVRSQDFVQKVQAAVGDPVLRAIDGSVIEVRAVISQTADRRTFSGLPLAIIGLSSDLAYDPALPTGAVTLQADSEALAAIVPDQVRILIDASQIRTPGTYQLKAICDPPAQSLVLSLEPKTVNLVVTQSPPPDRSNP